MRRRKKKADTRRTTKADARRTTKADARRTTKADARRTTKADAPVLYAYGFVRGDFDMASAPAGLDQTKVELMHSGEIAALVSRLAAAHYNASDVERQSGDVAWLSPRAMAHDRVLTWAQEHGGVIPLPMLSLWRSEKALARLLSARAPELRRVFSRVAGSDEFGVRVYRRDESIRNAIDELDPEIARLHREAEAAAPGQRYLLERKLAQTAKGAVRAVARRMAQQVFDSLRPLAREALARPIVPEAGRVQDATLVLNGAFLVDRARLEDFRAAMAEQVRTFQPRGLAFDFSGPWPPYNFVTDRKASARKSASQ